MRSSIVTAASSLGLLVVVAAGGSGCDRPIQLADGAIVQVAFDVPADARALKAPAVVTATAEIPGLAAETKLLVDDKGHAAGSLGFAVKAPQQTPAILRVYGALDDASTPVVIYVGNTTLDVAPGVELNLGSGVALTHTADAQHAFLDLNRNGKDNLGDLASGCDPGVPSAFVRVSATDVQFTAGVVSRQVVVVDNLVQRPITVRADVVDAPGVGVSILTAGAEQSPSLPSTGEVEVDAGGSLILALSFVPANPFLATGFLDIEEIDDVNIATGGDASRCKTRTSTTVRVIANVDGGPKAAAPGAAAPTLQPGADLGAGGFDPANVVGVPAENASSGAAIGVDLPVTPSGKTIGVAGGASSGGAGTSGATTAAPADAVFLVEVPRGGRLSASLSGFPFDADLHVFQLDANDKLGAELPRRPPPADASTTQSQAAPLPGTALEAADVVADQFIAAGASSLRVILVAGTSGATEARFAGASATTSAQGQLVAHVITAPRLVSPPSPPQGSVSGGTSVTLAGNGLRDGGSVKFGDVVAACQAIVDDGSGRESITCSSPAGTLDFGRDPVDVTYASPPDANGVVEVGALVQGFLYVPDAPVVSSVDPPAVSVDGGTLVTIHGFGFTDRYGPIAVTIGGVNATGVGLVDDTSLLAEVPAHAAGAVDVAVSIEAQDGSQLTGALPNGLLYVATVAPAPSIASVSPPVGDVAGGTEVTIFGASFTSGATVALVAPDSTSVDAQVLVVGSTAIVIDTPSVTALANQGAGAYDVVVTNLDGQSATLAGGFTYFSTPTPPPAPTSVSPSTGDVAGGAQVTIFGAGFATGANGGSAATVSFVAPDGTSIDADVIVAGSTALIVVTPAASAGAGQYDVVVTNPDAQSATLTHGFTYFVTPTPPPSLVSLTPASGDVAGGTQVTLIGADFAVASGTGASGTPGATVTIDGVSATITSAGAGAILVTTPPRATVGLVDVVVTNPDNQSATLHDGFQYTRGQQQQVTPAILDVTPNPAHASVAFEELTALGGDLETTVSARVLDTAGSFTSTATITQQSSALVQVVVDNALPASAALAVELTAADGSVARSPVFAAQAPTPLSVSAVGSAQQQSSFTIVVNGVQLDPAHLVSLRASPLDPASGSTTDLAVAFAAETLASATVAANQLGRGGWTISLVYDDTTVIPVDVLEVGGPCPGSALCSLCGDGVRDPGEQCDGRDFGGATCASLGFTGGTLSCTGCQLDATTCTQCGNGILEQGETCDGTNLGGATCATLGFAAPSSGAPTCNTSTCTLSAGSCAHCGDGVCSASESHASCPADCPAACGDGTCDAAAGETCSTCPRDCNTCAPYHLVLAASSTGQSAPITGTLASVISAKLLDQNDQPVKGAPVTFAPPAGDAMSSAVVVSDGIGQASAAWTLGPKVGVHTLSITAVSPDGTAIQNQPLTVDATANDVASGTIITLAGDGSTGSASTSFGPGGAGVHSHLNGPKGVAVTSTGDVVVLLTGACEILQLHLPQGTLSRLAGSGACNVSGTPSPDHLQANDPAMKLAAGKDVVIGPDGAVYFSENFAQPQSSLVRRIDPLSNEISVVAGTIGTSTTTAPFGDGAPATGGANIATIDGISFAPNGDLIVTDSAAARVHYRRFVAPATTGAAFGIASTIAIPTSFTSNTGLNFSGNLIGPAGPMLLASDAPSLLFVGSLAINANGFGNGGFAVCDAVASFCMVSNAGHGPQGMFPTVSAGTPAANGFYFGADSNGAVIRRFDAVGGEVVVAGNGTNGFSGDLGPATSAQIQTPTRVATTPNGDLVFVDARNTLRLVRGAASGSNDIAIAPSSGDAQTVGEFQLTPSSVIAKVTSSGVGAVSADVAIAAPSGGAALVTTAISDAGGFAGTQVFAPRLVEAFGGPPVDATYAVTLAAPLNRLFPAATTSFTVHTRLPNAGETLSTFTGALTGLPNPASRVAIKLSNSSQPSLTNNVLFDADGIGFLISDDNNHRVIHVDANGIATTFAGNFGQVGFGGDNGSAVGATVKLNRPSGLARDASGNVYIADTQNHRVRRVDVNGVITTFAGNGNFSESGDGGPAASAGVRFPWSLAVGADGFLYVLGSDSLRAISLTPPNNISTLTKTTNFQCNATAVNFLSSTSALGQSPSGRVFMGGRVTANAGCLGVTGADIFEVQNAALITTPIVKLADNTQNTTVDAVTMRADGTLLFEFENPIGSTTPRVLKALPPGGDPVTGVVAVPSAPAAHTISVGPVDGLFYLVDDTTDQLRIFGPTL